jgi:hypothetical protein
VICFAAMFTPGTLRDATPGAVGEPHVYTFEQQLGTHASVGGDQSYPFIMFPAGVPFDPAGIVTASDLYPRLKAYVRGETTGEPHPLPGAHSPPSPLAWRGGTPAKGVPLSGASAGDGTGG